MTPGTVDLVPPRARRGILLGVLIGLVLFGLIGVLAEAGLLGLPRLEPLFASPLGAVTALLAIFGGMLGALIGSLLTLPSAPPVGTANGTIVQVTHTEDREAVAHLAQQYNGQATSEDALPPTNPSGGPISACDPGGAYQFDWSHEWGDGAHRLAKVKVERQQVSNRFPPEPRASMARAPAETRPCCLRSVIAA